MNSDPREGGVWWPDMKQSNCNHTKVDCFPKTARTTKWFISHKPPQFAITTITVLNVSNVTLWDVFLVELGLLWNVRKRRQYLPSLVMAFWKSFSHQKAKSRSSSLREAQSRNRLGRSEPPVFKKKYLSVYGERSSVTHISWSGFLWFNNHRRHGYNGLVRIHNRFCSNTSYVRTCLVEGPPCKDAPSSV